MTEQVNGVAGDLIELVAFERRAATGDGLGGAVGGWVEAFRARAAFVHLRGGESVQAARLEGRHVQVVRVRASAASGAVTSDWRIRDLRRGTVLAIRDVEPSGDRRTIDFLSETGVAA